jgi:hypothetical protein
VLDFVADPDSLDEILIQLDEIRVEVYGV